MSAEAQPSYEPDLAPAAPPAAPRSTPGGRPAGAERRRRPRQEQGRSWNVLTDELVSFPRPGRHASFEELTGVQAPRREHADEADAARSRRYGEKWLQRELRTVRYLADAGYPSLPRRTLVRPEITGGAAGWTDGSSALAVPVPLDDDDLDSPDARPSRPRPGRPSRARPVTRPVGVPVPRRRPGELHRPHPQRASESVRGLRRLLPGVATLAALVGIWAGAGALSATHDPSLAVLPGSVKVAGGYSYVVRPGDTVWSIASRLEQGGDPRPLVARLESQLHGRTLVPGTRLLLP